LDKLFSYRDIVIKKKLIEIDFMRAKIADIKR